MSSRDTTASGPFFKIIQGGKRGTSKRPRRTKKVFQRRNQETIAALKHPGEHVLMFGYTVLGHSRLIEPIARLKWFLETYFDLSQGEVGLALIKFEARLCPQHRSRW